MNKLGYIPFPEQYADVGESCVLTNSVLAQKFFREHNDGAEGTVFMAGFYYASLHKPCLRHWIYVDLKDMRLIDYEPVFIVDDIKAYDELKLTDIKLMKEDCYFYWDDCLYAAITSSEETILIKRVRCLLSLYDIVDLATINGEVSVDDCYPVKLYSQEDGRFLAVCWKIVADNEEWYEPVCSDEYSLFKDKDAITPIDYPVSIGESVIIDDSFFTYSYRKSFGSYFKKTSFKATKADKEKENIPLENVPSLPKKPRFKVIFSKDVGKSDKKEHKNTSKIVALHPKK